MILLLNVYAEEGVFEGMGTKADTYRIADADDLLLLEKSVNEEGVTFEDRFFTLVDDIDLSGIVFTPIGIYDSGNYFFRTLLRNEPIRMDKIVERYRDYKGGDLEFELDFTKNNSIFESDVLITDWSGTAYEFAIVSGKLIAFIDTSMKIYNLDYKEIEIEPLEIRLRLQVGIRVSPDELTGFDKRIENLREKTASYVDKNKALRD